MYENDRFKGLEALGNVVGNVNFNLGSGNNNDNAEISFNDAADLIEQAAYGTSLPSFIKRTMVSSSVYIQRSCFDDEILSDVLQCAQQLYISWILTAVSLNGCLAGSKTLVRDAINVIATEDFTKPLNKYHINTKDIIKGIDNFGMFKPNSNIRRDYTLPRFDAFDDKITNLNSEIARLETEIRNLIEKIIELEEEIKEKQHENRANNPAVVDDLIRLRRNLEIAKRQKRELERQKSNKEKELVNTKNDQEKNRKDKEKEEQIKNTPIITSGAKLKDPIAESKLPVGRIVEVSIDSPNGKVQKVNITVNLFPQVIPDEVAHALFTLNKVESLTERWFKVKTGELRFWGDFLFELDKARDEKKAMKKDESGLLRTIKERDHSKLFKWIRDFGGYLYGAAKNGKYDPSKLRRNIANNIIVFNKSDFTRWCKEINLNINMDTARTKFMFKCMSMMFIVLDPDFQVVEMYYHGIKYKSEFSYKQISNQSKSEKYDLLSLMKAFNNANAPKF